MALPGERRRGFEGTFEERALRLGDCGSVGDVAQEWRRRIGGAVTVWRRSGGGVAEEGAVNIALLRLSSVGSGVKVSVYT